MQLHTIAFISIAIGILSFIIITVDILSGNKQHIMVMNFVWPLTGLYAGPLALLVYFTIGRKSAMKMHAHHNHHNMDNMPQKPFWQSVTVSALHCGSGCTLGDILAEILLLFITVSLFGSTLYGGWLIDFVFAFAIGIIFQYYAIKPMQNLSVKQALIAALKADSLSLISWQAGMYGTMAIAIFMVFKHRLEATNIVFWFVMQIAMLAGFVTAYPVNWLLLKKGIKEAM